MNAVHERDTSSSASLESTTAARWTAATARSTATEAASEGATAPAKAATHAFCRRVRVALANILEHGRILQHVGQDHEAHFTSTNENVVELRYATVTASSKSVL